MRAGTAMRRFPGATSRLTGTGGRSFRRMVFCGLVANLIIIQVRRQICPAVRSVHCHLLLGPYWFDVQGSRFKVSLFVT